MWQSLNEYQQSILSGVYVLFHSIDRYQNGRELTYSTIITLFQHYYFCSRHYLPPDKDPSEDVGNEVNFANTFEDSVWSLYFHVKIRTGEAYKSAAYPGWESKKEQRDSLQREECWAVSAGYGQSYCLRHSIPKIVQWGATLQTFEYMKYTL